MAFNNKVLSVIVAVLSVTMLLCVPVASSLSAADDNADTYVPTEVAKKIFGQDNTFLVVEEGTNGPIVKVNFTEDAIESLDMDVKDLLASQTPGEVSDLNKLIEGKGDVTISKGTAGGWSYKIAEDDKYTSDAVCALFDILKDIAHKVHIGTKETLSYNLIVGSEAEQKELDIEMTADGQTYAAIATLYSMISVFESEKSGEISNYELHFNPTFAMKQMIGGQEAFDKLTLKTLFDKFGNSDSRELFPGNYGIVDMICGKLLEAEGLFKTLSYVVYQYTDEGTKLVGFNDGAVTGTGFAGLCKSIANNIKGNGADVVFSEFKTQADPKEYKVDGQLGLNFGTTTTIWAGIIASTTYDESSEKQTIVEYDETTGNTTTTVIQTKWLESIKVVGLATDVTVKNSSGDVLERSFMLVVTDTMKSVTFSAYKPTGGTGYNEIITNVSLIDAAVMDQFIKACEETSKIVGGVTGGVLLTIDTTKQNATGHGVEMTAKVMHTFYESYKTGERLSDMNIITTEGSVFVDHNVLGELSAKNDDKVVSIKFGKASDMSEEQKKVLGNKTGFSLVITVGSSNVHLNSSVIVSANYTLKSGESADKLKVQYISSDGKVTAINSKYIAPTESSESGSVNFKCNDGGVYALYFEESSSSSNTAVIVVAIIIVVIALLAVVLYFCNKGKDGDKQA